MSRGGRPREGGIRRRTCVGCRQVRDQGALVRVVLAPGGLVRDEKQALSGRGAYLCPSASCAERAAPRLPKALRRPGWSIGAGELWDLARGVGTSGGAGAGGEG